MHSEHFITNSGEKSLSKILNGILPKTKAFDFLVGYFYFSGIKEIKEHIEDKEIRILVGMDMEKDLQNATAEFNFYQKKAQSSKQKIREDYYQEFTKIFNETELYESKEEQELFKTYFNKIKNGTLEIRKTKEPCHAKMYIFSLKDELTEEGENLGNVITGSSNLTYNGLRGQNEINVRFKGNPEYKDACQIFESLWQNAVVIADMNHIQEFDDGVIKKIWYEKMPSPYLMYVRCLHEYFHLDTQKRIRSPHSITNEKYMNLKYQEDAVRQAIDTLGKHNGVIISDVVGLGKSIIASSVAHNLDYRTMVIAPPHLVPQWEDYMNEFKVKPSKVFSRGVIEKALKYYRERVKENEIWLIIVDEAHNYRNEYIQDYGMLHELCQGNKVMLLTATPFNNQPSDIYSMLKLFQFPTKSTLNTVNNLGVAFIGLIGKYKTLKKEQKEKKISEIEVQKEVEMIAKQIRNIIQPLVIRRSRLDLDKITVYKEDLKKQNIEFPKVEDPQLLEYKLGELSDLYTSTLQRISHKDVNNTIDQDDDTPPEPLLENSFKATRYQPIIYVKDEYAKEVAKEIEDAGFEYHLFKGTQRNLAAFMRVLLVRRFESSQHAFKISLNNILYHCENIKKWAEKREAIPIYKKGFLPDIQELYNRCADTLFEEEEINAQIERFESKGLFELKTKYLKDDFFKDLEADIEILKKLKSEWEYIYKDPKTEEFIEILKNKIKNEPARKIVVFSQFADTTEYLGEKLVKAKLPVFAYTSKQASETNKNIIRENFDAGIDEKLQKNDYKILVATDAISEGYNLHRAGAIFNYDIPYNPTRVIQRVGRINRINKKVFDKLFIYNYFPTAIGEAETRIKEIATLKMAMIHAIMGEDTKILTTDEQLQSFFAEQYKKLMAEEEQISWDTEFREEYNSLVSTKDMKDALAIHHRSKIRRRTSLPKEGVLVVAKKKNDLLFLLGENGKPPQEIGAETGLKLLKTNIKEKPFKLSEQFDTQYDLVKQLLNSDELEGENEKQKRDALNKITLMIQKSACPLPYLEDLKTAIEYDAISGYALRCINRITPKEYATLPEKISNDYIQKILSTYDDIGQGIKTLILAEEIESDAVIAEIGRLF
ncbi:MAG: phospholipase D-like domain-containing protein [Bacteroidales bacterium]|jgi:superfamily II DNA/RNA helicase|nr:phospholipase D-like domain-containing protein [Bacteroidales bacterium]